MPATRRPSRAEQRRIQPASQPLLLASSTSTSTADAPSPSSSAPSPSLLPPPPSTTIILVHGLGRTSRSMNTLASRLEASTGMRAVSIGYPSRKLSVADAAAVVSARAADACGGPGRPAFAVTFSLGGPVVRHASLLGEKSDNSGGGPRWLGAVMLAPPNRGSDLARALLHAPSTPRIIGKLFRLMYGPAVLDLAAPAEAIARDWPDAPRPCGVIAGTAPRSLNPASLLLASRVFGGGPSPPRVHDGTVAVDETRLLPTPEDDFATVHAGHTLIAESRETAALVAAFLTRGRFSLEEEAEAEAEAKEKERKEKAENSVR